MISIEIPVTGGSHLETVLQSIRDQKLSNVEVVIVDSSFNSNIAFLASDYGARLIKGSLENFYNTLSITNHERFGPKDGRLGLLAARYLAHLSSTGEKVLLLDETRALLPGCLKKLESVEQDMVVIREHERGESLWSRLSELDKEVVMSQADSIKSPMRGVVIPRYFDRVVLDRAFEALTKNIQIHDFVRIIHGDHQLIYYEAHEVTNSLAVLDEALLIHFSDETLSTIIKKYYRYGKSDRIKTAIPHYEQMNWFQRFRVVKKPYQLIQLTPLYLARGLSFLAGYYLGI